MTQKMSQHYFFTGQCLLFRFLCLCNVDCRQDAEKVLLQDSSVLLCCTWVYILLHVALLLSATRAQSSAHIGNIYNITQWNIHIHSLLVLSTHLRDCCTQRKCHLLTNWLRDCTHGELVDQLVCPNILGWKTEDGCFVPHYLVTPNIQELDNFSIKKEKQETKEIEGKSSGKTQMIQCTMG